MNARAQDVPTALDLLRNHKAQVARVHAEMASFNELTDDAARLRGEVASIAAAINADKSARWPDPAAVARLLVEQDKAQTAVDRFEHKNRADLARAAQLQGEYAALAPRGVAFTAAALDEHFAAVATEAWSDMTALHKTAFVEMAAAALAPHLVRGHRDTAIVGLNMAYKGIVPINVPSSRALDALRLPENLEPLIVARARELIAEVQSA